MILQIYLLHTMNTAGGTDLPADRTGDFLITQFLAIRALLTGLVQCLQSHPLVGRDWLCQTRCRVLVYTSMVQGSVFVIAELFTKILMGGKTIHVLYVCLQKERNGDYET